MTKPIDNMEIVTLHRYYIWANRMRTDFDKRLSEIDASKVGIELFVEPGCYMAYWYGGLYVVIEGWRELGLQDPVIDNLLTSPNVDLLKRFRNGAYHFKRNYFDTRFFEFMASKENPAGWVRTLNQEFGRFFLNWYQSKGIKPSRQP